MKDLQTEQYSIIYDRPIYPKNLYLTRPPYKHAEYRDQVTRPTIEHLIRNGIWTPPSK